MSDARDDDPKPPAHRRLQLLEAYRGWHDESVDLTVPNPPCAPPTAGWQFSYLWEALTAFAFAAFVFVVALCVMGSLPDAVVSALPVAEVLTEVGIDPAWGASILLWTVVMPTAMYVLLLRPAWVDRVSGVDD